MPYKPGDKARLVTPFRKVRWEFKDGSVYTMKKGDIVTIMEDTRTEDTENLPPVKFVYVDNPKGYLYILPKYLEPHIEATHSKKCDCSINQLMSAGCICGGW